MCYTCEDINTLPNIKNLDMYTVNLQIVENNNNYVAHNGKII